MLASRGQCRLQFLELHRNATHTLHSGLPTSKLAWAMKGKNSSAYLLLLGYTGGWNTPSEGNETSCGVRSEHMRAGYSSQPNLPATDPPLVSLVTKGFERRRTLYNSAPLCHTHLLLQKTFIKEHQKHFVSTVLSCTLNCSVSAKPLACSRWHHWWTRATSPGCFVPSIIGLVNPEKK